ncbi:MAG: GGDEF domain-containing protein [Desulfobacterales bacterium]|nr:GGDEF domain-containing protein [Desulfobacterales bacterium]
MTLKILKAVESTLDAIFNKFYEVMLSNREFAIFFKSDDHIKSLIERQKKYFVDSLDDSEENLKARYTRLGEIHYDLKLPYVDFFAAMGILEEGILLEVCKQHESQEIMTAAFRFFRVIRAYTAKGYLNRMLDADSKDIDRYLENVHRSTEIDTLFATERIIWLKNLIFAIKVENRGAAPAFHVPSQIINALPMKKTKDRMLLEYIENTVSRIEINAANVFFFLEKQDYEEVLTLYRELLQIYKLSLMLSNVITIASSSWLISNLSKDKLTGLLTRHSLNAMIERELGLADASAYEISFIMVDLDHFKQVNDTHGHMAGDAVLKKVGEIMLDNIRATDLAFRLGGEEFLLVLKGASLKIASGQAETIRKEIQAHLFKHEGSNFRITASFGVSTFNSPFQVRFDKMLKEVDAKLYQAKEAGRNRVNSS